MRKLPKRIRDYLREQSVCCKPSTIAGYRLTLGCFYDQLKAESPNNPLASLNRDRLQAYLLHLCGRNLAPYTKVNYLLSVKKYLQWEVERGKLSETLLSVLDRSKLPPVPEYLPRPISSENDLCLQNIWRESGDPYAPFFLLLRQTGMRISELINLPPDCVLSGAKNEKYLKVPLGKMNTERLVPLCEESLSLIEKIRQDGTGHNRLIAMPGRIPQVYSHLSRHFKHLTGNRIDQNKPVTFHRLRHTYATSLLTGGVSLVSLMKLLGHRRIEMTLRYAKVTPSHLRDEYLKAIKIIEQQSTRQLRNQACLSDGQVHPATLISQAASLITKAALIDPLPRKNLLLRLQRLQDDLSQINFSQKFKPHATGEGIRAD